MQDILGFGGGKTEAVPPFYDKVKDIVGRCISDGADRPVMVLSIDGDPQMACTPCPCASCHAFHVLSPLLCINEIFTKVVPPA